LESDLNQFDKLITLESGEYRPPCTAIDQTIHNNANADNISYSTDTSSDDSNPTNSYTGNTSKFALNEHYGKINSDIYNHTQFTMPAKVKPKSSHITSNTAELVLPIFSESSLKKFSKSKVNKSRTELISEEIIYTNLPPAQLPEAPVIDNSYHLTPKESGNITSHINKVDTSIDDPQDIPPNMQLSKSKVTVPTSNMTSSKQGELVILGFSDSTVCRLDRAVVNKSTDTLPSNKQETSSKNTNGALSVREPNWQKYNNKDGAKSSIPDDLVCTIQPPTPELIEPASSLMSSLTAELIVPKFSDSKLNQFNEYIIGNYTSSSSSTNRDIPTANDRMERSKVALTSRVHTYVSSELEININQVSCNPIQPTVPSLANSKQSIVCSNSAELSIPALSNLNLKRFNDPNADELSTSLSSENMVISATHGQRKASGETPILDQENHNRSKLGRTSMRLVYDPIQITIPCLAKLRQSPISSGAAESSIPKFPGSTITQVSQNNIKESNTASSSRDITTSRIIESNAHKSSACGIQQGIAVTHSDQTKGKSKYNSHTEASSTIQSPIQLSKQGLKASEQQQKSSNLAELVIPIFSTAYLKRCSKTGVNDYDGPLPTTCFKADTSKNGKAIPVHTAISEGLNNSGSNANTCVSRVDTAYFQLSTPELKEPTTILTCSNNAELVIPLFSTSLATRVSKFKTTKLDVVSIPEIDGDECSIPTSPKVNDSGNTTAVSYRSNKGKNVASSERLPTDPYRTSEPLKLNTTSSSSGHSIKKGM
jgi:hypothetical protein